ncbi:uncharacterized protein LOC144020369 [Festucalex cinctus]
METWTGFCPGLHFALGVWLVIAAHTFQNTKAEISCASRRSLVQLHTKPTDGLGAVQNIQVEFRGIGISRQNAGKDNDHEEATDLKNDTENHRVGSKAKPDFGDGGALLRAKRNSPEFAELSMSGLTGQSDLNSGTSEERGSYLDGFRSSGLSRSELRKNRDDGRGNKQQDEPKLTSSTFALTGDSAHNHAVVYWSGQNSSVILILTKLYDFHIGSVTESTLWRSSDSGSTYEKMNDKVGSKTVLSYLYVCPTNKKKIMVLTDPEFESSVLISSDEGASYQKYRLTFFILSLLFHPTEEDWALAYSHDQKSSFFYAPRCPVEHVLLLAPFVVIRHKEVNVSAVVLPTHPRTVTYFWWLGNTTEPMVTLDGSVSYTFPNEGTYTLTVQVAAGNLIFQDTKIIAVREFFKSLLLSFSPNLDEFNPDLSEWRQDVGKVIKKAVLQVAEFPEEQLLVAVFPGVPTAAELFLLPHKNQSHDKKKSEQELEQISNIIVSALNQNLVEFELKPGVRVIVYNTQLTLAPLVDSNPRHRSSAMLMLLSVVFLGLAVFLIYKFKRKIPWINIYAEVNQEKEQEMISSVGQGDNTPKITLNEFSSSKELMEKELDARVKRGLANARESTREIPNCTSV